MVNKLNQYMLALGALHQLTETYQQIAAMRMRKAKSSVLQNRDYYGPLLKTYQEVSTNYFDVYHKPFRKEANNKTLALLITTNTGLYGPINRAVFDLFIKSEANSQSDLAVAGRLGKTWLDDAQLDRNYLYFEIEDGINSEEVRVRYLFEYVRKYTQVKIYHGMFKNAASQPAQLTELTTKYTSTLSEQPTLSFIFEPSIEKVLGIFDQQLLSAFFTQTVLEANLAKNGSRMMSLDGASQHILASLKKTKLQELILKHQTHNKKQQEQVTAFFSRITP